MSSLIEAIHIRGGQVQQTSQHGLTFLELSLPIPGFDQTQVQVTRKWDNANDKDQLLLEALREAQIILNSVQEKLREAQE